ncbi:MAG: H(+)/Cl(-) exchange transporter ClcA [Parvibaculaceae bacterium]|nr:H(+)/Cl(-) exchange transporter ClcA [Parvibaculaceae bacterium]
MADNEKPASRLPEARYYLISAIMGALTGLAGTLFHLGVDGLQHWPEWVASLFSGAPRLVLTVTVAIFMVVYSLYLVRRHAPEAGGSGVQEIEGALAGLRPLRWARVLAVKFVAGILALSSGLVLGREGPTIHIGAAIAGGVAQYTKLDALERRGLLAAGAAAGLAAAFNAPLAAILFIIEETRQHFPYTLRTYMAVIIATCASTIVTQNIAGLGAVLVIPAAETPLWMLPGFLLLGMTLGGFGVVFNFLLLRSLDGAAWVSDRIPYLLPAIVAAAAGWCLVHLPEMTGGNEKLILALVHGGLPVSALIGLVGLRLVATLFSYSTGVPGGIFAPILTLATCVGLVFGVAINAVLPGAETAPAAFAIAAMGGLFAASVRAPIVATVLALELTGSYGLMLPVLLTCATANLIAQWLRGEPVYELLLARTLRRAGIAVPAAPERTPLEPGQERLDG